MPTSSKPATLAKLNDLIQLDSDAIQIYDKAVTRVDDLVARQDLEAFMADHGRHVAELTQATFDLGGQAKAASRTLQGGALESMTALREAPGTRGALEAVLIYERLAVKIYTAVAELRLPQAASRVVLRNLDDQRRHLATTELHLARLARADGAITQEDLTFEELELTELDDLVIIEIDDVPRERV